MITPEEWIGLVNEVTAIWGTDRRWAKAPELWKRMRSLSPEAVRSAIEDAFLAGNSKAPSLAELYASAAAKMGKEASSIVHPDECQHPGWAVVSEEPDGRRHGICRVCRLERVFAAGRLVTDSERDEQRRELIDVAP